MIVTSEFKVPIEVMQIAINSIPLFESKLALNQPTGQFFYDTWEIKSEFKDTIWEIILNTVNLPKGKGEARLIRLPIKTCYMGHADLDDRWHLSLTGEHCHLVDLDNNILYQTLEVGQWYSMDASYRHSAINFGPCERIQLVIRKLLDINNLLDPIAVIIHVGDRYIFDDIISPWLNRACKKGIIANILFQEGNMELDVENEYLEILIKLINHTSSKLLIKQPSSNRRII